MKTLLLGMTLFISFSTLSYELTTNVYKATFSGNYSDLRGLDYACSITTVKDYDDIVIIVNPVGTGHWVQLSVPASRLPLKEGDDFVVKSITGDMRLNYNNRVLTFRINDINDSQYLNKYKDVGSVEIGPNLTKPGYVDVSVVLADENMFGTVKVKKVQTLKCQF